MVFRRYKMALAERIAGFLTLLAAVAAAQTGPTSNRYNTIYSSTTPGAVRWYELPANGSSYIEMRGQESLTGNRVVNVPGGASTTLVGWENYQYSNVSGMTVVGYRARGTEASPSNVTGNEVTLGLYGYARSGGTFSPTSGVVQSVESVSPTVGRFSFYTDNGSGFGERLSISGAGNLLPASQTQTIGAALNHWGAAYISSVQIDSPSSSAVMSIVPPNFSSSFTLTLPGSNSAGYLYNDGSGATSWTSSSITPPVTWDLDNTSDVLTIGSHNSSAAQQLVTRFSRGTTASPTAASNGDQIVQWTMQYYAGSGYKDAAAIFAYVADSTPSNDSYGGRLTFLTSDPCTVSCSGGNPADAKMWIDTQITTSVGVLPNVNDALSLGSSGYQWGAVYSDTYSAAGAINVIANTAIWQFATSGRLTPVINAATSIGSSTVMPDEVWGQTFRSSTSSGYGIQNHNFSADSSVNINLYSYGGSGSTNRGGFHAYRSGGTQSSPSAVANGDRLGLLAAHGFSNSQYNAAAVIEAYVNGTVSGTTVPTEWRHRTMNTGGTLADRWIMRPAGHWVPAANITYDLGESGTKIRDIYAGGYLYLDGTYAGNANVGISWLPASNNTYDLGSTSYRWNEGFADSWYAETALYVQTSGTTRFSASGGGVNVYNSSGTLKFSVAATTGTVDAAGGYKYNGTAGITQSISVRKGDDSASCTLTVDGGIITATTC